MPVILNIETATTVCSVALAENGRLLAIKEQGGDYTHAENLTLFVQNVMEQASLSFADMDAIAVSKGPGSYTGLRIGVSVAKGLCYALNKPLIAVDTLQQIAFSHISKRQNIADFYCPMLDARRMEVYCAMYSSSNQIIQPTSAEIIDENSFSEFLNKGKVCFLGNGAEKCKKVLGNNSNALFVDNITTSAANMIELSEKAFLSGKFENVAYFEPFYLKDFIAGKKKKEQV